MQHPPRGKFLGASVALALVALLPMTAAAHTDIFFGLNLGGWFGPPELEYAPRVYSSAPPVYYAPPTVYYTAPPVYYVPHPIYRRPTVIYYDHRGWHHHHGWGRGHWSHHHWDRGNRSDRHGD